MEHISLRMVFNVSVAPSSDNPARPSPQPPTDVKYMSQCFPGILMYSLQQQ
jgi:hypothetical protein